MAMALDATGDEREVKDLREVLRDEEDPHMVRAIGSALMYLRTPDDESDEVLFHCPSISTENVQPTACYAIDVFGDMGIARGQAVGWSFSYPISPARDSTSHH